jgi:hypothetical protein
MTDLTHSIRKCAPITRITQVLAAIYKGNSTAYDLPAFTTYNGVLGVGIEWLCVAAHRPGQQGVTDEREIRFGADLQATQLAAGLQEAQQIMW